MTDIDFGGIGNMAIGLAGAGIMVGLANRMMDNRPYNRGYRRTYYEPRRQYYQPRYMTQKPRAKNYRPYYYGPKTLEVGTIPINPIRIW